MDSFFFKILLIISLVGSTTFAQLLEDSNSNRPPEEPKFHFVLPSTKRHFMADRDGDFKIEFRDMPFSKMQESLEICRRENCLPDFNSEKPPALYIYLP